MKNSFNRRIIAVFVLFFHVALYAQQWSDQLKPARLMVGADYGAFRISLREFEQLYVNRWGLGMGAVAGIRVFGAYYLTAKYGYFNQSGRVDQNLTDQLDQARWREQWYKVGARIHPLPGGKWASYYGFGLALYDIKESEGQSVFLLKNSKKYQDVGSGFYIEAGIEHFLQPKTALYLDAEVASGGVRGRTGFEAMSIGGWRFAAGVSFWPF